MVHPDIADQVTSSLLESLLSETVRTAQNKPREVYRVPKLNDLFYAACGQLLAITADECTKKQDTVLELALLLVNPMRAAAPRNKSLFQWKLHENKPIAYPRRRATGVMLAIIRMLLRRTLQRLGQGMSVSEDVTSLVTLMRGWDFKSNDKSDEKNEEEEDETKRGIRLLRWWLSLVLVSVHSKVTKGVDLKKREDVLEQLRDLLQRTWCSSAKRENFFSYYHSLILIEIHARNVRSKFMLEMYDRNARSNTRSNTHSNTRSNTHSNITKAQLALRARTQVHFQDASLRGETM